MLIWVFLLSAILLSFERVSYVWICRNPERFGAIAHRIASGPIEALRMLFYGFKVLQLAVFLGWCYAAGGGRLWPPTGSSPAFMLGLGLIIVGQILNAGVFYQLGKRGVFYGTKFGHALPWCRGFPFSLLAHPQYVGTAMSIWGFFLIMRFPHSDWLAIPTLETLYYFLGSRLER
jgi:phosphatidyl-N-methylethanolamine N-methyltransferase